MVLSLKNMGQTLEGLLGFDKLEQQSEEELLLSAYDMELRELTRQIDTLESKDVSITSHSSITYTKEGSELRNLRKKQTQLISELEPIARRYLSQDKEIKLELFVGTPYETLEKIVRTLDSPYRERREVEMSLGNGVTDTRKPLRAIEKALKRRK